MSAITVFIADDNLVIRRGLCSLLESQQDIAVVGEASNGVEAVNWVRDHAVDVVLMDIRMPVMDGIAATAEINRVRPDTRVIILSIVDDPATLARAIHAGAKGCIAYGRMVARDVAEKIRAVASDGSLSIPSDVVAALISTNDTGMTAPVGGRVGSLASLSSREKQILDLIADGESNTAIARLLGIEPKTVKNHIASIYSKLNISSRYEAICLRLKEVSSNRFF